MNIHAYINILIRTLRAGFKKRKVIRHFFGRRVAIATHFGKVIRNCELLFAIYSHFCTLYIKSV